MTLVLPENNNREKEPLVFLLIINKGFNSLERLNVKLTEDFFYLLGLLLFQQVYKSLRKVWLPMDLVELKELDFLLIAARRVSTQAFGHAQVSI
jgi:hypothetical protein